MALPKRKISKSRRDKRRAHHKVMLPSLSLCTQCNEPKLPHHACLMCGTYKGRKIIKIEEV